MIEGFAIDKRQREKEREEEKRGDSGAGVFGVSEQLRYGENGGRKMNALPG